MKVSLNWVKQFTDIDLPLDKLVDKIGAQLGAVEEVVELGLRYAGVVVVRVVACQKHPNGDKLSICMVDDGGVVKKMPRDTNGLVQVICGAPNVEAGMLAAWIPPGVTVPSTFGFEPLVVEPREIRGQTSNGMLASPKELAFGADHDGLLVVDEDTRPGTPLTDVYKLDDHIIDIENKMFTHRPDLFGILGVAREIAGIQGKAFKSPSWYLDSKTKSQIQNETELSLEIKNELPKLVPRFCAVAISGVTVAPSPMWLQSYLMRVGIKPVNNIVDLTNFVMYETGQPLHAYDFDKLNGSVLIARHPKPGEELKILGGKTIELQEDVIVMADAKGAVGLGGVMGGVASEVDEDTRNIVLECANFDMNSVRKSAMAYGLFTDAATRFTKNQTPLQNLVVLAKAVDDIRRIAGGQPAGPLQDIKTNKVVQPASLKVSVDFINSLLGEQLSAASMAELLENVEIKVKLSGSDLVLTPPFWRTDIVIPEDLVEEVGRLYGYDHLPRILPKRSLAPAKQNRELAFEQKLRQAAVAAGANELLTYSFVHGSLMQKAGQDSSKAYNIRNALSPDLQYFRLSLAPSLLEKVHPNIKAGYSRFALFEIGVVHQKGVLDSEKLPAEPARFGLVVANKKPHRQGSAYFQARRYTDYLLDRLGLAGISYQPVSGLRSVPPIWKPTLEIFDKGRSATITAGSKLVGFVGEPHAQLSAGLKLPSYCAVAELDLEALQELANPHSYQSLNRFPPLGQDICFRVAAGLEYGKIHGFLDKHLSQSCAKQGYGYNLAPISIYQRDNQPRYKQITWHLSVWHPQRTLTTTEINNLLDGLAQAAKSRIQAVRI